jgi:heat shock protein HslJ
MKKTVLLLTLFAVLVTGSAVTAAPASQSPDGEVYIVQPNDWLMKIAEKFYGDANAYRVIVEATNVKAAEDVSFAVIDNPSLIRVGQKLWIPAQAQPVAAESELTLEALQNAMYHGIYDEPVQLADGRYEGEPFVPGGASRPTVVLHPEVYAFGDLNGDGVDDAAVILIESSGGSGNFRYLAAVINEDGISVNVATQFIGDREQVQAISIDGNEITVDVVSHGPDDPMCCPTQEATKMYRLQDDQLVEVVVGLEGTTWVLVSYGDPSDPQAVLAGSEITAEFDSAEGTVTGSAGCNNYFGSYEVDGETITFGPLGSTLMACPEPEGVMEQETAYLAALGSAATYRIEGDKLELVDADGTRVAQFIALPPASLAGTEWTLTAYNNGQDAVVSVLIGTEITAAFGDDSRLTGSAGCNTYGASYEVDGSNITLGPAVTTRMWCPEPEGIMDQESAFLAALGLAATYRIQGDKLEMRTTDGALALQFTAKPTEPADGEAYIVQPGDWLMKIAEKFYGDAAAYCVIVEATNGKAAEDASFAVIDNPSLIRAGQKLWIPAQPGTAEGDLTLEALQNAVYQGIYDEPVQLTDGRYEGEPFVPGGASRPTVTFHPEVYAFGDLNGDGVDDAVVILIENSGGSGSFIYLAAVINEDGAPVNVATAFVGDREQAQALTIEDGEITLEMVAHGPDDPMCCPTQEVTKRYQLQGDQLAEL